MENFYWSMNTLNDPENWIKIFTSTCREYMQKPTKDGQNSFSRSLEDVISKKQNYLFGICNIDGENENWIVYVIKTCNGEKTGKNLELNYKLHLDQYDHNEKINILHEKLMQTVGDHLIHHQFIGYGNCSDKIDNLSLAFYQLVKLSTPDDADKLDNDLKLFYYKRFFKVNVDLIKEEMKQKNQINVKFLKIYEAFKVLVNYRQYDSVDVKEMCILFIQYFQYVSNNNQIINLGYDFFKLLCTFKNQFDLKMLYDELKSLSMLLLSIKNKNHNEKQPLRQHSSFPIHLTKPLNNQNLKKEKEAKITIELTINISIPVNISIDMNSILSLNQEIQLLSNLNNITPELVSVQSVINLFVKMPDIGKKCKENILTDKKKKLEAEKNLNKQTQLLEEINELENNLNQLNNCSNINEAVDLCETELLIKIFDNAIQSSNDSVIQIPVEVVNKLFEIGVTTKDKRLITIIMSFSEKIFLNNHILLDSYFSFLYKILVECISDKEQELRKKAFDGLKKYKNILNPLHTLIYQLEQLCTEDLSIYDICVQLIQMNKQITFNAFMHLQHKTTRIFSRDSVLIIHNIILYNIQKIPQKLVDNVKKYIGTLDYDTNDFEIIENMCLICNSLLAGQYITFDDIPITFFEKLKRDRKQLHNLSKLIGHPESNISTNLLKKVMSSNFGSDFIKNQFKNINVNCLKNFNADKKRRDNALEAIKSNSYHYDEYCVKVLRSLVIHEVDRVMRYKIFKAFVTILPESYTEKFDINVKRILNSIEECPGFDISDIMYFWMKDVSVDKAPFIDIILSQLVYANKTDNEICLKHLMTIIEFSEQNSKSIVALKSKKILMLIKISRIEETKKKLLSIIKSFGEEKVEDLCALEEIINMKFHLHDEKIYEKLKTFYVFINTDIYLAYSEQIKQLIYALKLSNDRELLSFIGKTILKFYNKQEFDEKDWLAITEMINNNYSKLLEPSIADLLTLAISKGFISRKSISVAVLQFFMNCHSKNFPNIRQILNLVFLVTQNSLLVHHRMVERLFDLVYTTSDTVVQTFSLLILHKNLRIHYKTKPLLESICLFDESSNIKNVDSIRAISFKLLKETATKEFIYNYYQIHQQKFKEPKKHDDLIKLYLNEPNVSKNKFYKLVQTLTEEKSIKINYDSGDAMYLELLSNELLIQIQKMLDKNETIDYQMTDIEINNFIENIEHLKIKNNFIENIEHLKIKNKTNSLLNFSVNDILELMISHQKRSCLLLEDVNDILEYLKSSSIDRKIFNHQSINDPKIYDTLKKMWLKEIFINLNQHINESDLNHLQQQLIFRPKIISSFLIKCRKFPLNEIITFFEALNYSTMHINKREEILMKTQSSCSIVTCYRKLFEQTIMQVLYDEDIIDEYLDTEEEALIKKFSMKLSRLVTIGWKYQSIFEIINYIDNIEKLKLINNSLDKIFEYRLKENDCSTKGDLLIYLLTSISNICLNEIVSQIIFEKRQNANTTNIENISKNVLMNQLKIQNDRHFADDCKIKLDYLYTELFYLYTKTSQNLDLNKTSLDAHMFRKNLRALPYAQKEAIVLLVAEAHFKKTLNENEFYSLICLRNDKCGGKIVAQADFQLSQSMVLPIAAVLKAIDDDKVDIIVSSEDIAKHLCESHKAFYEIFDIKTSCNNMSLVDVVYATSKTFQLNVLQNNRNMRPFDTVLVTDISSMLFFDACIVMDPLFDSYLPQLEPIIIEIWNVINELDEKIINDNILSNFHHNLNENTFAQRIAIEEFAYFYMKLITDENFNLGINLVYKKIKIPTELKEYVNNVLLKTLIKNAIYVKYICKERIHYEIIQDEFKFTNTNFDFSNWLWTKSKYFYGLEQFLQLKHGKRLTPIMIPTKFITNIDYFQKYNRKIFAICDFVEVNESNYLQGLYGRKTFRIPSFNLRHAELLSSIFTWKEEQWIEEIINACSRRLETGIVVIFTKTSNDLENIVDCLNKSKWDKEFQTFDFKQKRYPHSIQLAQNEKKIFIVNIYKTRDLIFEFPIDTTQKYHICWTFHPFYDYPRYQLEKLPNIQTIQMIICNQTEMDEKSFEQRFLAKHIDNHIKSNIEMRQLLTMQKIQNNFTEFLDSIIKPDITLFKTKIIESYKKFGVWLSTSIFTYGNRFDDLQSEFELLKNNIRAELLKFKDNLNTSSKQKDFIRIKEPTGKIEGQKSMTIQYDKVLFSENHIFTELYKQQKIKDDSSLTVQLHHLQHLFRQLTVSNLSKIISKKRDTSESICPTPNDQSSCNVQQLEIYMDSCQKLIKQKLDNDSQREPFAEILTQFLAESLQKYKKIELEQCSNRQLSIMSHENTSHDISSYIANSETKVEKFLEKDTRNISLCYQKAVSDVVNRQIIIYNEQKIVIRVLGDNQIHEPIKLIYQNSSESNSTGHWSLFDDAEPYFDDPSDNDFINLVAYELDIIPKVLKSEVVKMLAKNLKAISTDTEHLCKLNEYKDSIFVVMACYNGKNEVDAKQLLDDSEGIAGENYTTNLGHPRMHVITNVNGQGIKISSFLQSSYRKTVFLSEQEQDILAHAILNSKEGQSILNLLNQDNNDRVSLKIAIDKLNLPKPPNGSFLMNTYENGKLKPTTAQKICGLCIVIQHRQGKMKELNEPVHVLTFYPLSKAPKKTKKEILND